MDLFAEFQRLAAKKKGGKLQLVFFNWNTVSKFQENCIQVLFFLLFGPPSGTLYLEDKVVIESLH